MQKPTTPITTVCIDASALKKAGCIRNLFFEVVLGYKKKGPINNDTHIGTSFHAFRAEYRKTKDEYLGIKEALKVWGAEQVHIKDKKPWLTEKFLKDLCLQYATQYPTLSDPLQPVFDHNNRQWLIEPITKFAFPFMVKNGISIVVAGTQDEIAILKANSYEGGEGNTIVDAKFSGAWNSWEFFNDAYMGPQGKIYRWSIMKYAEYKPESVWRELNDSPNLGFMIDAVFYKAPAKAGSGMPQTEFKRSRRMVFKQWELDEFEGMLKDLCNDLVDYIRIFNVTGEVPPRYGTLIGLCTERKFGVCEYCPACSAKDDEAMEAWLEESYQVRDYNPLNFGGKVK